MPPMSRKLSLGPTDAQRRILAYLQRRELEGGFPPTYREIATDLGWRAAGTVRDHVLALVRKGLLSRSRLARGLRLTEAGREAAATPAGGAPAAALFRAFSAEIRDALAALAFYFRPRRFPAGWGGGGSR